MSLARKRLTSSGAEFSFEETEGDGSTERISISVKESQPLENGGRLLKLAVTGFVPDIDTGYIQKNDRIHVENALREDPVQLLDYIMIDNNYNGQFACRILTEEVSGDVVVIAPGRVKIKAVDVFGREYDGGII